MFSGVCVGLVVVDTSSDIVCACDECGWSIGTCVECVVWEGCNNDIIIIKSISSDDNYY